MHRPHLKPQRIIGWTLAAVSQAGAIITALDWWARIEFAVSKAMWLYEHMSGIRSIMTSPWFEISFLVVGLALVVRSYEVEVSELDKRTRGRLIAHPAAMSERLKQQTGKIHLAYMPGDAEVSRLVYQISDILEAGGWTVESFDNVLGVVAFGLELSVRDPSAPPPRARLLKELLEASVHQVTFGPTNPTWDPDYVQLFVGGKPVA